MDFSVISDNLSYLLLGAYPDGPLGGAALTLLLASLSGLASAVLGLVLGVALAVLPGDSGDALICTFECTFCRDCATVRLGGQCPNCGGELLARPRRPRDALARHPASSRRVVRPGGCPE